jgi:hypothetical protein
MDIVLKILAVIGIILLEFIKVSMILWNTKDIRKFREERKKEKQKREKEYPYLPFDEVTPHYGWSYELVHGKWSYIIWYHEDGKPIHSVMISLKNSRANIIRMCEAIETMYRVPVPTKEEENNG